MVSPPLNAGGWTEVASSTRYRLRNYYPSSVREYLFDRNQSKISGISSRWCCCRRTIGGGELLLRVAGAWLCGRDAVCRKPKGGPARSAGDFSKRAIGDRMRGEL